MALESANQPIRWLQRIGTTSIGYVAKITESVFFDEFVYGLLSAWAIGKFGTDLGASVTFLIMTPISALFCFLYILIYDRLKEDFFNFEALKGIRDGVLPAGKWRRFLARMIRWGDFPAFVVLNCFWPGGDAFMATVYLRKKEHSFNGLTRRDWDIFWASILLSNAYWTLRWTVIVVSASYLWHMFVQPSSHWLGIN